MVTVHNGDAVNQNFYSEWPKQMRKQGNNKTERDTLDSGLY
jgi:hypothetical protein